MRYTRSYFKATEGGEKSFMYDLMEIHCEEPVTKLILTLNFKAKFLFFFLHRTTKEKLFQGTTGLSNLMAKKLALWTRAF